MIKIECNKHDAEHTACMVHITGNRKQLFLEFAAVIQSMIESFQKNDMTETDSAKTRGIIADILEMIADDL